MDASSRAFAASIGASSLRGQAVRDYIGKAELKLEIDADLLAQARERGLDLNTIVEAGVRKALVQLESDARAWAEENAEALQAQRERLAAFGLFGDDLRSW
jgi:post-segregation antitoxin (ccd killing protein)